MLVPIESFRDATWFDNSQMQDNQLNANTAKLQMCEFSKENYIFSCTDILNHKLSALLMSIQKIAANLFCGHHAKCSIFYKSSFRKQKTYLLISNLLRAVAQKVMRFWRKLDASLTFSIRNTLWHFQSEVWMGSGFSGFSSTPSQSKGGSLFCPLAIHLWMQHASY